MTRSRHLPASCRPRLEALEARNLLAPTMTHPDLDVRTVVSGLTQPTQIAFLDGNDFFVSEKGTGRVRRVTDGKIGATVLDLNVNSASERGLLGMALHPDFPNNPGVYLYWTESSVGADTTVLAETTLLGNRVDRFTWDGARLRFDQNIARIRALQPAFGMETQRGNHDGGVITFGPDGKLYIITGDVGRRGVMQNNTQGPFPDDQFGGPEPDDAHRTGVILRLNDNGTAPTDNPFYDYGASLGSEVGANIQKLYAYGVRNSFGMAFDPYSGTLWNQENADDAFDEINRIESGHNGGWVNIMGPVERIAEFKDIEVNMFGGTMQQLRWPPTNIADTPEEALDRLYVLPGSHYADPEFSWKFAVPPAGIGFVLGKGLGSEFEGDLFAGAATPITAGGYLFRFKLNLARTHFVFDDERLDDKVADNLAKHDPTESESLFIGQGFGVGTDIKTGPNGNVYVVSLTDGAVYEIFRIKAGPSLGGTGTRVGDVVPVLVKMDSRPIPSMNVVFPDAVFADRVSSVETVLVEESDPVIETRRIGQRLAPSDLLVDDLQLDVLPQGTL